MVRVSQSPGPERAPTAGRWVLRDAVGLLVRSRPEWSVARSAGPTSPTDGVDKTRAITAATMNACSLIQSTHMLQPARGRLLLGARRSAVLPCWSAGLGAGVAGVRGLPWYKDLADVVRPTPDQMIVGGAGLGSLARRAHRFLAIVGTIRLSVVAATVLRRPKTGPVGSVADAPAMSTSWHRRPAARRQAHPNLVVGPFGVAIVGELPSPKNLCRRGSAWEIAASTAAGRPSRARSSTQPATPTASAVGSPPTIATSSSRSIQRRRRERAHCPNIRLRGHRRGSDPGLARVAAAAALPQRRPTGRHYRSDPLDRLGSRPPGPSLSQPATGRMSTYWPSMPG